MLLYQLCISIVTVMLEGSYGMDMVIVPKDINADLPANYKEIIGDELLECARFISENNIQDAVNMAEKYYNKAGLKWSGKELKATKREFKNLYDQFSKVFASPIAPFSTKDYIFEDCLNYFWWNWK